MTGTRSICSVCGTVFSEHGASINPADPEEGRIRCPNCGSTRLEPYEFDPDGPVDNPLEGPNEEEGAV